MTGRARRPKRAKRTPPARDGGEPDRLRATLFEWIGDFVNKHDLRFGTVSFWLVNLAVAMRVAGYAQSARKPTPAGLRLDLDGMRRDLGELVRFFQSAAALVTTHRRKSAARKARPRRRRAGSRAAKAALSRRRRNRL